MSLIEKMIERGEMSSGLEAEAMVEVLRDEFRAELAAENVFLEASVGNRIVAWVAETSHALECECSKEAPCRGDFDRQPHTLDDLLGILRCERNRMAKAKLPDAEIAWRLREGQPYTGELPDDQECARCLETGGRGVMHHQWKHLLRSHRLQISADGKQVFECQSEMVRGPGVLYAFHLRSVEGTPHWRRETCWCAS